MDTAFTLLAGLSLLVWIIVLILPWQPWRHTEHLDPEATAAESDLSDVTVVIPARNEARVILPTLQGVAAQGDGIRVMLVDDQSQDGTSDLAKSLQGIELTIVPGDSLPPGWSGKLWALEQGVREVKTRLTLLLDADIVLQPGVISALKGVMVQDNRQLVSLMASLNMDNIWEKLLLPSFIYFFKMIYPFRLAGSRYRQFAAAAGGCILLETRLFDDIGGLASIKDAVIDDCALAGCVKEKGNRIWIGQSRAVDSIRSYDQLGDIWNMVMRTAYTQLRYSLIILLGLTLVMVLMFWIPVLGVLYPDSTIRMLSALAWLGMTVSYLPTILYYGLNPTWSLSMPLIGTMYLAMTWHSATRYWRGERSRWKGRVYSS